MKVYGCSYCRQAGHPFKAFSDKNIPSFCRRFLHPKSLGSYTDIELFYKLFKLVFFSLSAAFLGYVLYASLFMGSVETPKVATQVKTSPSQPSEDIFIHPQCLEFLAPWDRSDSDSIDCSEFEPSTILKMGNEFGVRHGDGGSQSIVYSYPDVDDYLSDNPDFRLLEVGIDGGGSGIFSSIALLERDRLNLNKYTVWARTPDGDRCNDGKKWVSKSTSDGFEFKAAATPFRLINPQGTTDWRNWHLASEVSKLGGKELERPPVFNEWLPYDDVVNSANACVGWVVRRYDYETGFEIIGVELSAHLQTELKSDDPSLSSCINGWLGSQTNEEGSYFRINDWSNRLHQLTEICGVVALMN